MKISSRVQAARTQLDGKKGERAVRDEGHRSHEFQYGDTLAIADINGDGREDIVIST